MAIFNFIQLSLSLPNLDNYRSHHTFFFPSDVSIKMLSFTDWEAEIAATDELSRSEFEEHEISQLVRDSYTEDFVRIMPHSVIQGDFKGIHVQLNVKYQDDIFTKSFHCFQLIFVNFGSESYPGSCLLVSAKQKKQVQTRQRTQKKIYLLMGVVVFSFRVVCMLCV